MPARPQNHLFTLRLLFLAIITAIITAAVLGGLYEAFEWRNSMTEIVQSTYVK